MMTQSIVVFTGVMSLLNGLAVLMVKIAVCHKGV